MTSAECSQLRVPRRGESTQSWRTHISPPAPSRRCALGNFSGFLVLRTGKLQQHFILGSYLHIYSLQASVWLPLWNYSAQMYIFEYLFIFLNARSIWSHLTWPQFCCMSWAMPLLCKTVHLCDTMLTGFIAFSLLILQVFLCLGTKSGCCGSGEVGLWSLLSWEEGVGQPCDACLELGVSVQWGGFWPTCRGHEERLFWDCGK